MKSLSDALADALEDHQAGRLEAAEAVYRQILHVEPRHADALRLTGLIAHQRGQYQLAIDLVGRSLAVAATPVHYLNLGMAYEGLNRWDSAIENYSQAVALDPSSADAHNTLGNAYRARGDLSAAVASYRAAVAALPNYAIAHYNLGGLLFERGDLEGALIHCRRAVQLDPGDVDSLLNLGNVHRARGELDAAADCCRRALAIAPNSGVALNNFGNVLALQGDQEQALEQYRAAVAAQPPLALAHYNLGGMLQERGDFANALHHCRRAAELDPEDAESHFRLGAAFDQLKDSVAAEHSYERAVARNPGHSQAYINLGLIHLKARDPLGAGTDFTRALAANPHSAKAHVGLAMVNLQLGEWDQAWNDYEWRLKTKEFALPHAGIERPSWAGEPLQGARILLIDEQGLGDALQFVRYAPLVAANGGRVLLRARTHLRRLLSTVRGIESVSTFDEPLPDFDAQCPLLSLPRAFATTLPTVPANVPYLCADPEKVISWRRRLGTHGYKVGVCWQGSVRNTGIGRSFAAAELRRIAAIPGLRLISLQKGAGVEQLGSLPGDLRIETLGEDFDAGPDALVDAAAVIENLELVITCDTSIAHLAGALGRPTLVALQYSPDWRWMLDRDDSPWYPSQRLFRQAADGHWSSVFDSMYRYLSDRLS